MRTTLRRRRLLAALVTSGGIATAGCLGSNGSVVGRSDSTAREIQVDLGVVCEETGGTFDFSDARPPTEIDGAQTTPETTYGDGELPLREEPLHLGHARETLLENHMSGGVEFGVSGRLVNSNLVMWDRAFDVRWPQVAATAIWVGDRAGDGGDELIGRSLREFRIVWTTWGRWRDRRPDTLVMTTDTGFARNYNEDPYGSYTPVSGHYAIDTARRPDFPLLSGPDGNEKQVVIGARTDAGAIAFDKLTLLEASVLTGTIGETPVVAVADEGLLTGRVYANPDGLEVTPAGDGRSYTVDGETAPAEELPLEPIVAFDAMWFAWFGFYPETERVGI